MKLSIAYHGLFCQVCGGENVGKHYNGLVCNCCRVFFLRETRRIKKPRCRGRPTGCCTILPGVIDNCRSCRYQKCLDIGMEPAEVGKKEDVKNVKKEKTKKEVLDGEELGIIENDVNTSSNFQATNEQQNSVIIEEDQLNWVVGKYQLPVKHQRPGSSQIMTIQNNISAGFMFLGTLQSVKTASDYTNCLISLQNFVDNSTGVDPIEVYANVEVSLADVLLNSQACSSRAAAAWDKWTPEPDAHFSMKHAYCRSITRYVDYLTAAPELYNLSEKDKMRLIQSNSTDLSVLGAIYDVWQHKIGMSAKYLKERSQRFRLESSEQEKVDNMQMRLKPYFENFVETLSRLEITTGELLLLKYIVFFTAPVGISSTGTIIINAAREKYCNLLNSYLTEMNPQMPWSVRLKRVADLIAMVRMIKEAAIFVKQLYANFASTNTGGMAGSLTFDLHLREY